MKAKHETERLFKKLADGSLPEDEPLFCLRAQDCLAADIVREWAHQAERAGTPQVKCAEALELSSMMDNWPVKQIPGRPDTRSPAPPAGEEE